MLHESERAFCVECFDQRDTLWKKSAYGKNGEFSLSGCTYDVEIRNGDFTWQRMMLRDFCWLLDERRYVDLLIALQCLIKRKHNCFLIGILEALQMGQLGMLQCWGYNWYDRHPEEINSA